MSLWFNNQGLLVRSAHNNGGSRDLPIINLWTTVVVDQIQKNDDRKHLFSVSIGGKEVFSVEDTKPEKLVNVKVFASDPRLPAQPGAIRNLVIETGGEFYKIFFISCLHLSIVVMFSSITATVHCCKFHDSTFAGVSTAFEFTVLIFPVDCNQKSRWEDGTCITSCPFCGPILSPKAGFGEAREEKETSPEEKQESACPSGKIIRSV